MSERGSTAVGRVRKKGLTFGLISAAAVLIAAGGLVGVAMILTPPTGGELDLKGNTVHVDPGTLPAAAAMKAMNPVADTGERFVVPSVKLDVPLGAISETNKNVTPPGFTSAYLVRNLGTTPANASAGTVYVVMHSVRGGGIGPGNYLINLNSGDSAVAVGAKIQVAEATYTVTTSETVSKAKLPEDTSVWQNSPGRLVVITCLQQPSGAPSQDNLVITAQQTAAG